MSTATVGPLADEAATLVIRALLDYRTLWTTHDLVTTTGLPAPTIRRLVAHLEQEELVRRHGPGVVAVPDWLVLLQRWSKDFRFKGQANLSRWRPKRRTPPFLERIPTTQIRHAVTGAQAAHHWAPDTPAGPPVIYTPDAELAATAWELVPAKTTSIILAEPTTDIVYTRTRTTDSGLRLAAPTQVLADLLTGTIKSPRSATPLTTWMLNNEREWRY
ncbi:helix-turn-helix domain-containing protein [Kribbella sp. HUAS MG21]|uniref:Helix-turn-helix domain-containing protein n=1 Tax=Kribbella sp. HUAS MG21 TaxID=3160966 RepID=A0AAU7TMY3_9ACTN